MSNEAPPNVNANGSQAAAAASVASSASAASSASGPPATSGTAIPTVEETSVKVAKSPKAPKLRSMGPVKVTQFDPSSPLVDPAEVMDKLVKTAREAARETREANKQSAIETAKQSAKELAAENKINRGVARELEAENKAKVLDFASLSTATTNVAATPITIDGNGEPIVAATENASVEEMSHPDDGIEILCKMAEKGEIDPKNVDIIDVCDKFLKAIASTPQESLRMSGKVIFHAAVLLRLKAEALLSEATNAIAPVVDDFLDFDDEGGPIIYDSNKQEIGRQLTFKDLEGAIVRRAQRKQQVRERRVTLDQLIAALKEAEKLETVRQEKKPKAPRIDLSGYNEVNDVDDILDLAHDEDIEGTIVRVEQWIAENLNLGDSIEFLQLVMKVSLKRDWVESFLAALFLSNAGKIDLAQEIFYGPLYLSLCRDQPAVANLLEVGDKIANGG
ncbi:MAG: segregation/condensation protein A [Cyanobacteria bacterium REEB67]|nr:segregation/condensation protein A [Cyanobacteria bacterium REEB67]